MAKGARYNCGRCHTCGAWLETQPDGTEFCPVCGETRYYRSHGWGRWGDGPAQCPAAPAYMDRAIPNPEPLAL
jgi:predicted RNA-binding Zn-ribbon protein involved in translation (DUF1610 family)